MDDREEYTAPNLFPGVQETKTVDFTLLSDILEVKKEDYLVVVTRGHSCDADVERFALRTPASYIGVVGSNERLSTSEKNYWRRASPMKNLTVYMHQLE